MPPSVISLLLALISRCGVISLAAVDLGLWWGVLTSVHVPGMTVTVLTRLRAGRPENHGSVPGGEGRWSFSRCPTVPPGTISSDQNGRGVTLTRYFPSVFLYGGTTKIILPFPWNRAPFLQKKNRLEARNQKRQPMEYGDCYSIASFGLKNSPLYFEGCSEFFAMFKNFSCIACFRPDLVEKHCPN